MRSSANVEEVFRRHFAMVYRLCYSYLGTAADAEDAAQTVFVRLVNAPRAFRDVEHEKAWLIVCASNVCKDELKSARRRRVVPLTERAEATTGTLDEVDETIDAVLALPAKYKDCVYLHYYEGCTTGEIAQLLHIPASTVRNRLRDARSLLRKSLGGARS